MFIQKFINRKEELGFLNSEYKKSKPFFIVLYGRRRVGKTELIKQFIKNKDSIYFLASQEVEKENISSFSEELAEFFKDSSLKINPFFNFKQIMEYLKEKSKKLKNKTIIIFDEFPYLTDANKAVPSLLQKYWDEYFKNSKLGFILCGSSIGAMETEVLGRKSPLYGRRTGQWKVNPLLFKDVIKFFPKMNFESLIKIYSIIGGIPLYLLEINPELDFFENIKINIARKGVFLYEEASFILTEELREPRVYFSLLKEISLGKTKLNDIRNALGVERTLLGRYIETLETLDLVEKQSPITAKLKSKNTLYILKDNFFKFWFRFVFPYKKDLERGENKNFLTNLDKNLNSFIGHSFEQVCLEYLRNSKEFNINKFGRQWGKMINFANKKESYEIDIVGLNEKNKNILFAEVKWKEDVNTNEILSKLILKSKNVLWGNEERKESYVIFAKSFAKKINEFEGKKVYCFDLNDIKNGFFQT